MPPVVLPTDAAPTANPSPSNPADQPSHLEPTAGRSESIRRASHGLWTAMAAAAMVVLLVAALAVVRSRQGQPDATDPAAGPSSTVATDENSVLLPRTAPDGMQAVDVTTSRPSGRQHLGLDQTGPAVTQLFGVDQDGELSIRIEPSGVGARQSGGVDQTIRGTPGRYMAAGQPTILDRTDGSYALFQPDATNDRYSWYEHDAIITASFRHLTAAQALAVVEAMRWASPDLADGFVLAVDAGLTVLLPPTPEPSTGLGLEADLDYVVPPDATTAIKVTTCPGGTGSCPGADYDPATAWLNGTRAADGRIVASIDGHAAGPGTVPATHGVYLQIGPDGATAQVDFGEGKPVDPDLAHRLVADLEVTDRSGLDRLRADISTGLGAMPVLAGVDLPSGRVEVHGAGRLSVTCVTPPGGSLTCGTPWLQPVRGQAPTTPLDVSAIVDGHWFVAASSTRPGPIAFNSGDTVDFDHPAGPPLAGETASATVSGTIYQFGLVEVPDDVTGIMLTQSSPGSTGGGSVERPAG